MAETNVASGSSIAIKHYSAALFANTLKGASAIENLVGPVEPNSAMEKVAGQTEPGMPIVRIDNLMKSAGDIVSLDLVDTISGEPLMGDVNREGKGDALSFSSMEIKINLSSKVIDAGGSMSQQRTKHQLREIALAQLSGYFPRLDNQETLVHLAGARGSQTGSDWTIPVQSSAKFTDIMVNAVKAPTYNRHFVVNGAGLTAGGQQLNSIASTDQLKLVHLDLLRKRLDDMDQPLQSVKLAGDRAAQTSKMWVFLATPNQYSVLLSEGSLRAFQQNAVNRAAYLDSRHPLFAGEVGMWNGILVIKNERAIRFMPGENTSIVTAANAPTATETSQAVSGSLTAGYAVERGLLLGAQALGVAYGKTKVSGMQFGWKEHWYNFESNLEVMGEKVCGKSKVRFSVDDGTGSKVPTDFGVIAVDSAVPL
ncbi:major capsid protein, N4-gp56 family [Nitrosospira sp. Nsp11]|uniref:N4-gp56 family major capsid protein n=1 Tax=Nitrosospira sp. Nsp11 TaxID=1855338 RepID=UPI00091DDE3E|nr:N4-gp56 family major capsid protein [Nitrosospira sp. Nsp11]SHL42678.1 major capsid protein, N4-gp56 family [Nitrosospira sp. Nsp11]